MKNKLAILSLASLIAAPAYSDVQINGFANLIGGMTLDDGETIYGYDEDFSFDPASVFGLQVRGDVSEKLSATAQLVGRGSEDYDVSFEWAYMTYNVSETTNVSAGRLRMPLFKYSASLDVGYSYHWLTPPESVYGVDFNNVDGVRVDYQNYLGDWEYNIQLTAGNINADTTISGQPAELEIKNVVSLSTDFTYDWFSTRMLYASGKVTAANEGFDSFIGGLRQFSQVIPTVNAYASNTEIVDDTGTFFEVAIDIDKYDWFLGAEFTRTEVDDSFISPNDAWYVTAGMRFGKFTPHITYESDKSDIDDALANIATLPSTISSGDPVTDATWSALYQGAVGGAQTQLYDTSAVTLGLRYDVEPGFALKADVTWYSDELNSDNDATLLRIGANYTF